MTEMNINIPGSVAKFEVAMKNRFLVKTIFYEKIFRGKGVEFDSYRDYTPNDDASLIDWKATKKAGKTLVKQYIEERSLKIFFIVDVGDNMVFGSGEKLKNEMAAEIASSLGHLIVGLGDSIGFALYSNKIISMRMFSRGMKHFYTFARDLSNPKNYGGASDLTKTLKFLFPYLAGASSVFIISDFIKLDKEFYDTLKRFASRYETIGIMVRDPVDMKMPDLNREIIIENVYTGEQMLINPSLIKHRYEENALKQKKEIEREFKEVNAGLIDVYTNEDFVKPLVAFLKGRVERKEYIMPRR